MNSDLMTLRKEEIYNYIAKCRIATIQDISNALKISQSTIRRDVKALYEQNRIMSFHGGVVVNRGYDTFTERTIRNITEKKAIALAAADLVNNDDLIFIGGGSTTFEFALALSCKNNLLHITVVTSAFNIAKCFINKKNFKVFIAGGEFEAEDESMISETMMNVISRFNFNKSFIGTQAINAKQGYTIPKYKLSELKKVVVQHSNELILLADHTKVGKVSPYTVCDISKIDVLITDDYSENKEEIDNMKECGVKIIEV